jgi:tetratricopeptide (TPR) repeat protein
MHQESGDADQALALHQRVLAAARKAGARRSEATAWMFIGQWYHSQKRWPEALDATNRCLAIVSPKTKPKVRIALAGIHQAMSQPEKALDVYEQAYGELEATDELADQFVCLREISELRMKLGRREAAIKALRQALDLAHVLELPSEEQIRAQLRQWQNGAP